MRKTENHRLPRRRRDERDPTDEHRSPACRPVDRWHIRLFEFTSPEAAVLFAVCTAAVAMTVDIWPVLELDRRRVKLRLYTRPEASPLERAAWTQWVEWAARLGARDVTEPASELK